MKRLILLFFCFSLNAAQTTQSRARQRTRQCIDMVDRAARFFKNHELVESLRQFTEKSEWRFGEVYTFVFEGSGTCLAHGDDSNMIWKNFNEYKDLSGRPWYHKCLLKDTQAAGHIMNGIMDLNGHTQKT